MTGEKNRFKTTEKLWNLDDKQLSSPVHDAMVLWLMEESNAKQMLEPLTYFNTYHEFVHSDRLDDCSFEIRSEIPFQAQNGFINGYGDLEIRRFQLIKDKYYECRVSEEVLSEIEDAETVGDIMEILKGKYMITEFTPSSDLNRYKMKKSYYDEDILPMEQWKYAEYDSQEKLADKLSDFFHNFQEIPPEMKKHGLDDWILRNNYYKFKSNHIICLIEVKPYIDSFGAVLRQINSYKQFWNRRSYVNEGKFVCLFTLDDRFDSQFQQQGIQVLHPPVNFDINKVMEHYGLN